MCIFLNHVSFFYGEREFDPGYFLLRNILSIKRSASSGVIEMFLLRLQYKTQFRNVLCDTPVSLLWHPHAIHILPKYTEKLYIDRKKQNNKHQMFYFWKKHFLAGDACCCQKTCLRFTLRNFGNL